MLTDLDTAVRGSGLSVVEDAGWASRGRSRGPARSIVCHTTDTPTSVRGDYPTGRMLIAGRSDLSGPLANLGLSRSGVVHVIAAGRANHAGRTALDVQTNSNSIGIEADWDEGEKMPAAMYDAYVRLVASLCRHYKLPVSRVYSHAEAAVPRGRKTDPGFDMDAFRARVAAAIVGDVPAATAIPVVRPKGLLAVTGVWDQRTQMALAHAAGLERITSQREFWRAVQRWAGLVGDDVDGILGGTTSAAIARKVGDPRHPAWSSKLIRSIQTYLNEEGHTR